MTINNLADIGTTHELDAIEIALSTIATFGALIFGLTSVGVFMIAGGKPKSSERLMPTTIGVMFVGLYVLTQWYVFSHAITMGGYIKGALIVQLLIGIALGILGLKDDDKDYQRAFIWGGCTLAVVVALTLGLAGLAEVVAFVGTT